MIEKNGDSTLHVAELVEPAFEKRFFIDTRPLSRVEARSKQEERRNPPFFPNKVDEGEGGKKNGIRREARQVLW